MTNKQSGQRLSGAASTGNADLMRSINKGIVLDLVRQRTSISRAEISKVTGLSRSTCSLIVDELTRVGLLVETGAGHSSGGRKPVMLSINYDAGDAVGVKLMTDRIVGAIVDLRGDIVALEEHTASYADGPGPYLAALSEIVGGLINKRAAEHRPGGLFGIGVGVSGLVDPASGTALETSVLHWHNVEVKGALEGFQLPVLVENDVNAFALGEVWFGHGRGMDNVLCVTIGAGVGLGVIVDGNIYRGAHRGAGEFGHVRVSADPGAPVDSAGIQGSVEAFASDDSILAYYRKTGGGETRVTSVSDIAAAARRGDKNAAEAIRRAARHLGIGVAALINLFDPEAILLSGEGIGDADVWMPSLQEAIGESTAYGLDRLCPIKIVPSDESMWVRGVATLVVQEVFRLNI